MHRHLILLIACAALLFSGSVRHVSAALPPVKISGTVVGFETQTSLIGVNTGLGRRSYLVNSSTLILLNNHTAARTDIQVGDEVTLTYQYETSIARTIHLFRSARRTGTVGTTAASSLQLRLSQRANLQLQVNASSVIRVEGIPLTDKGVLTGVRARAVYEPGTLLLLNLQATSKLGRGQIVAVDGTANTLSISGRRNLAFAVDPLATIRRAGLTAELGDLAVDDRVVVAYVKDGTTLRVLAIEATPTTPG